MKIINTPIEDLKVIELENFEDERGSFKETWNEKKINFIKTKFVQDNESLSKKNVIRGLHFQNPPYEQGKLVRVTYGSVIDVAVDLRKNSKTYGKHFSIELNDKNNYLFWIPPGFAHGFLCLQDNTVFNYKCTNYYNKNAEECLIWNDPDINIKWDTIEPIVSSKDLQGIRLKDFKSRF
ncbi:MAG: dTDP-4-dehydrorhamnose 3,5-epimerase [Flavobacteriales bacterium]|nr:dTDP-4-dehydrorhamnose 3,5-epimerase [Flavobacteriales bacterium]